MGLTSKDRVLLSILGKKDEVDRIAVTSVNQAVTLEQMDSLGVYWPEGHKDAQKMAQLGMAAYKQCGLEAVHSPFDQTIEAEIMGCTINYGNTKDAIPTVFFQGYKDPGEVPIPENFLEKGRIPMVLKAIEIMKKEVGEEAPIISNVNGPFSLGGQLAEINNLFMMLMTDPEKVKGFAEIGIDLIAEFANAQLDAGADVVAVADMLAGADVLTPKLYKTYAAPYNSTCIKKINEPKILYVCGPVEPIIEEMINTGAICISVGNGTNLEQAVPPTRGRCTIMGCINTTSVLLDTKPETVKKHVIDAIKAGIDLVAPGCFILPQTKNENIKAMVEAAKEYCTT